MMNFFKMIIGMILGLLVLLVAFVVLFDDSDGEYEEYTVSSASPSNFYGSYSDDNDDEYDDDEDYEDDDDDYYYDDDDEDDDDDDDEDEEEDDDDDDYYGGDNDEIDNTPVGGDNRYNRTLDNSSDNNSSDDDDDDDNVAPEVNSNWGDGTLLVISKSQFASLIADISADKSKFLGDGPAVVEIFAASSTRSAALAASLEKIAPDYKGSVQFYKVDLDQYSDLYTVYSLKGVPALLFCKGSEIAVYNGAPKSNEDLIKKIDHIK